MKAPTMKTLLAILMNFLPGFFQTTAKPWLKVLAALVILAQILLYLLLTHTGCMTTTDLDGKKYSFRVDSLTPIQATTGPSAGHPNVNIHVHPAQAATAPAQPKGR